MLFIAVHKISVLALMRSDGNLNDAHAVVDGELIQSIGASGAPAGAALGADTKLLHHDQVGTLAQYACHPAHCVMSGMLLQRLE
jgi:hypothetical protein